MRFARTYRVTGIPLRVSGVYLPRHCPIKRRESTAIAICGGLFCVLIRSSDLQSGQAFAAGGGEAADAHWLVADH